MLAQLAQVTIVSRKEWELISKGKYFGERALAPENRIIPSFAVFEVPHYTNALKEFQDLG